MKLNNFEIVFNEKEKVKDKNVLIVYGDKSKIKKLKVPSKIIDKKSFKENKPFSFGPFKGYKKVIILPFNKKDLNVFVLSKLTPKIEENTTIDLRSLPKEYQDLAIEFILSNSYSFDKYKSKEEEEEEEKEKTIKINFLTTKRDFKEVMNKIEALYFARNLINERSNNLSPKDFVERAKEKLKDLPIEIEVYDKKRLEKENFNLILAVGKGSENDPYLMVIKYLPKENEKPIVIVGKGVCFDTGGYCLKPYPHILEMYMDMSGAAVALGTIYALAKNNINKNVIAVIPLVENAISGRSYKPDDIVKSRSGKFVEIKHTDAEGRLILADAVDLATEFNPREIITIATLTGAAIIALGGEVAAIMGTNEKKINRLKEIGLKIEERVWELPLYEEIYRDYIKSEDADIVNISDRGAGTIIGGLFIKSFAKDYDFIHIDIAGPAMRKKPFNHFPRGGTAFGLRLLYEYLKKF